MNGLAKISGVFTNVWSGAKKLLKSKYAPAIGILGAGGAAVGLSGILSAPNKRSVAAALVDFAIKAKPARYSGFTPAIREKAIGELVSNFNKDSVLFEKARKAFNGLKRNRMI